MSRRHRLSVALLVAFTLAGLLSVVLQSSEARRSADFTIDYSAALLIREGHADAIYDWQRLGALTLRLSDDAMDPRVPFAAPLALALPYVPLTFIPMELAFHLWQLVTVGLLFLALVLLARWLPLSPRAAWLGLLALLAFPATWALLSEGQSSAMLLLGAALLVGAWRRDSLLLGCGGGALLAMKPHYLPVYLILLLGARHWRALGGALCGGVVVGLSPLLDGGVHGLASMVLSALEARGQVIRYDESLIGTLAPLLPGSYASYVGFAIWAVVLVTLTGLALRWPLKDRVPGDSQVAAAMAMTSAGLLFAPYALPHDLVLLAVPAWLTFVLHREGKLANPTLAWVIVGLALLVDLQGSFVQLAPIAMAGVIVWSRWGRRRGHTTEDQRRPLERTG